MSKQPKPRPEDTAFYTRDEVVYTSSPEIDARKAEQERREQLVRRVPAKSALSAMHKMASAGVRLDTSVEGIEQETAFDEDRKDREAVERVERILDTYLPKQSYADHVEGYSDVDMVRLVRQGLVCVFSNHGAGGCSDPKCPTRVMMVVGADYTVHTKSTCKEFVAPSPGSLPKQSAALQCMDFCTDCEVN